MNRSTYQRKVLQLRCFVHHNLWGKVGHESQVANLLKVSHPDCLIEPDLPYAELWMGTHPSGPSSVCVPGLAELSLADWLRCHPEQLGDWALKDCSGSLPFLFKVLSVNKALALQAHPDKELGQVLHQREPGIYVDPNHKPEMAVALTEFTGLCGFRPIEEVARFLQDIPELRAVIGQEKADTLVQLSILPTTRAHEDIMKVCFSALLKSKEQEMTSQLRVLLNRVKDLEMHGVDTSRYIGDILMRIADEYPGDVGAFTIYFLNVMRLKQGEAIFIDANVPHAYLYGDCIECMACSHNVIRGALTSKYRDIDTLLEMLDYRGRSAENTKFPAILSVDHGCYIRQFSPNIDDFAVTEIEVPPGLQMTTLSGVPSASIILCIKGNGELSERDASQSIYMGRGSALFIAANEETLLTVSSTNGMLLYRAHANY